jgi:predicted nucleotidyltransferase
MADQRECITIDEVRNRLATVAGEIRSLGIRRLAVFGSVARGEAGPTSDVDLLVEFEPGRKGLVPFLDLADLLESHWTPINVARETAFCGRDGPNTGGPTLDTHQPAAQSGSRLGNGL